MPGNIREADFALGHTPKITPSNEAPAAFARIGEARQKGADAIGQAIAGVAKTIGGNISQLQTQNDQLEQSKLAADASSLDLNLNQQWDTYLKTADPNDPQLQEKFWGQVNGQLDAYEQGATTPKNKIYAQNKVTELRSSIGKTMAADVSNIAAANVTTNFTSYISGKEAMVNQHPEKLDDALASLSTDLPALIGTNVDPVVAAKDKAVFAQEAGARLVANAVDGMINQAIHMTKPDGTPDIEGATAAAQHVLDLFNSGKMDKYAGVINASQGADGFQKLRGAAEAGVKAVQSLKDANDKAIEKAATDQLDKITADIRGGLYNPDGTINSNPDTLKKIYALSAWASDPKVPAPVQKAAQDQVDTLFKLVNSNNKAAGTVDEKTSEATANGFLSRIGGNNPPTELEVDKAFNARQINSSDLANVRNAIASEKTKTTSDPTASAAIADMRKSVLNLHGTFSAAGRLTLPDGSVLDGGTAGSSGSGGFFGFGAGEPKASDAQVIANVRNYQAFINRRLSNMTTEEAKDALDPTSKNYLPNQYNWVNAWKMSGRSTPLSVPGAAGPAVKPPLNSDGTIPNFFGGSLNKTSYTVPTPTPAPKFTAAEDNLFPGPSSASVPPSTYVTPGAASAVNSVATSVGHPIPVSLPSGQSINDVAASAPQGPATHEAVIQLASSMLGENETANTQALSGFIKKAAGININPATTAWCAAWANAVLAASGYAQGRGNGAKGTVGNGEWAFDFENYGTDARPDPTNGDVVVFRWKGGGGHVGFFMGYQEVGGKQYVQVLGGNQGTVGGGQVSISLEPADQISAIRHPVPYQEGTNA
jgi:hypothetical protein